MCIEHKQYIRLRSHSAAHGIQKVAIEEQIWIANNTSQVTTGLRIAGCIRPR